MIFLPSPSFGRILQAFAILVPFVALILVWPFMPERVPVHWNFAGEPDRWTSNPMELFLLPVLNVGMAFIPTLVAALDPKLRAQTPEQRRTTLRAVRGITLALHLFFCGVILFMIAAILGIHMNLTVAVELGSLLLIAYLGNVMAKLQPNYLVGIRTPWTLEDPDIWRRTHRLGGIVMVVTALLLALLLFLLPPGWYIGVMLTALIVMALIPIGYSYLLYRCQQRA